MLTENMENWILWFQEILQAAIQLYFHQPSDIQELEEVEEPDNGFLEEITGISRHSIVLEEKVVILMALMPHICPQVLDIFFVNNKNFDRPYTEFGGWKGISHSGFLPTGETVAFILAGENRGKRAAVIRLFDKEHWFRTGNVLRLEPAGPGEPFLSGQLCISDEVLYRIFHGKEYRPDYSMGFPAKRITTLLEWKDLVLSYQVAIELGEINTWITGHRIIMEKWGLKRFLKPGYRALFYGPPGTGKTLAATLLGKRNHMDVYRVDLSMIVSKYIGETEKNLAQVFDMAENRNWILFFDEADALFGKRTSTHTSNDRHANQEVAYLLQRIEDFPGTVILATNLNSNIDEAFSRRFQSEIYFPMPDEEMRAELWNNMLPLHWLKSGREDAINQIAVYELSGGSISNVIRRCALHLLSETKDELDIDTFRHAVQRELYKEGRV